MLLHVTCQSELLQRFKTFSLKAICVDFFPKRILLCKLKKDLVNLISLGPFRRDRWNYPPCVSIFTLF